MTTAAAPTLFISYAAEDRQRATDLYNRLGKQGYRPWIDHLDILPGQKWETAIFSALRRADLILVCLSTRSISKRGFLQKEIRRALSHWEEKLESDIYIIPTRLEECAVPEALNAFQRVDLFARDGFDRLRRAIDAGAAARQTATEGAGRGPAPVKLIEYRELPSGPRSFEINIRYPQLGAGRIAQGVLDEVNTAIRAYVQHTAMIHRAVAHEDRLRVESGGADNDLQGDGVVTLATDEIISVAMDFYSFTAPAAHGTKWRKSLTFGLHPLCILELEHIVGPYGRYEAPLVRLFMKQCRAQHDDEYPGLGLVDELKNKAPYEALRYLMDGGGFNLTEESLLLWYNGPYAVGLVQAALSYSSVRKYLSPAGPLAWLRSSRSKSIARPRRRR